MRRDLHSNISNTPALNPALINSNTTTNGPIIDSKGFGALEFLIQSGAITDGTFTPNILVGNQSNLSDAQNIAVADLIGSYALSTFALAADANKAKRVGVKLGTFRYFRLQIVSTGITSGGTLGAQAVLGDPAVNPVAG